MSRAAGSGARPTGGRAATLVLLAAVALLLLAVAGPALPFRLITVDSGSMAPTIPSGSLALERTVPATAVRVGQVISYVPPEHAVEVTHRLVWRTWDADRRMTFRTRGDANPGEDPWQPTLVGDRVWTVVAAAPALGAVLSSTRAAATEPPVLAVAAAAVLGVIWLGGARPGRSRRAASLVVAVLLGTAAASTALVAGGEPAQAAFTTDAASGHAVSSGTLLAPTLSSATPGCVLAKPQVALVWRSSADQRTGTAIERTLGAASSSSVWTRVGTADASATTWTDTGVTGLTAYSYRLLEVAGGWTGPYSGVLGATTLSANCTVTVTASTAP